MFPAADPSDLNAVMRQNEALKTFIAILVLRLGGDIKLTKIDFAKTIMLNCNTLPDGHVHMVATHL